MEQKDQNIIEKQRFRSQMKTAGVVIFTACCIILFYFMIQRYHGFGAAWDKIMSVCAGIIIGFVLAFLMNPIMVFLEKKILPFFLRHSKNEEKTRKSVRLLCSVLALIAVVGIVVVFFIYIIPEFYESIKYLADHIYEQIQGILDWANDITGGKFAKQINNAKNSDIDAGIQNLIAMVQDYLNLSKDEMLEKVVTGAISIGKLAVNLVIGLIVSVYVLCSKENFKAQAKKIAYGLFSAKVANVMLEIGRKTSEIFYGFIIGKIIDSIVIGIICAIFMKIVGLPYILLCSVVIGVTNIIPVFGPYFGAVPTVIILFLTNPTQGITFLIFVIVLQQVDGNIIGPAILGDSTGLSPFWVVVAIVVGGGLFGVPGMIVGVPTMALLYYLVGRFISYRVEKKGLSRETADYLNMDYVDTETNEMVNHTAAYGEERHYVNLKMFEKKKMLIKARKEKNQKNKSE
ncbi:MAG: AI-2E family transporter [Lachnospiraceae bacterium]|nr:AI-2E family transporter [Lachnospiraceae bacterium]